MHIYSYEGFLNYLCRLKNVHNKERILTFKVWHTEELNYNSHTRMYTDVLRLHITLP